MPIRPEGKQPFATLESALAFMHLLSAEIGDTLDDVRRDITDAELSSDSRHVQALQLVDFKLQQLSLHVGKSERILRDLSRLRTLILDTGNRAVRDAVVKSYAAAVTDR